MILDTNLLLVNAGNFAAADWHVARFHASTAAEQFPRMMFL